MYKFDPIDYLTKLFKPGSFIGTDPVIGTNATGDRNIDLDTMVVAGIVRKDRTGYYMATVEEMARRCDDRLTKIAQGSNGYCELTIGLPSAPRAYAFDVAADEMAYGDRCLVDPSRSDCSSKSHVEHLALIEQCCAEAKRAFYEQPGQDAVGEQIRKIEALRAKLNRTEPVSVGGRLDKAAFGAWTAPNVSQARLQNSTPKHTYTGVDVNLRTTRISLCRPGTYLEKNR